MDFKTATRLHGTRMELTLFDKLNLARCAAERFSNGFERGEVATAKAWMRQRVVFAVFTHESPEGKPFNYVTD